MGDKAGEKRERGCGADGPGREAAEERRSEKRMAKRFVVRRETAAVAALAVVVVAPADCWREAGLEEGE